MNATQKQSSLNCGTSRSSRSKFLSVTLLVVVIRVYCGTLYTVQNSTLWTVDTTTFEVGPVGPLGVTFQYGDLAWNPNTHTLYMVDGRGFRSLYTVNTMTGAATLVGPHNVPDLFGLTYDTATAKLYGADFIGVGQFYELDTTTGEASAIGSGIGSRIGALASNPSAGLILGLNDCLGCASLYSVDPESGAGTLLRSAGLSSNNSGMTYDPILNRFWNLDVDGRLSYFDPANGYQQVQVARLPGSFDGLAFVASGNGNNSPPTVSCPAAATVECGALTTLTANVFDAEGDALLAVWKFNGIALQTNYMAAGGTPAPATISFTGSLPLGPNELTISVTDSADNSTSCTTTISVVDTSPPIISSLSTTPNNLWPPNHELLPILLEAVVTDTCGPATWRIISVTSNESVNGQGDGNTSTDWVITGDHTVNLRAERSGNGSGRIYIIAIRATDASANTSEPATVAVTVAHDQ